MEEEYVIGDIAAQMEAVELLEKEFLSLVWVKGYQGARERHERIQGALKKAGGAMDARAIDALFYQLEQVAIREIRKLAHLAQSGTEAIDLYPDLPEQLMGNIREIEKWIMIHKRNKEIAKKDRVIPGQKENKKEFQRYWDDWKGGKITYAGVTKFDEAMVDKLGISRTSAQKWRKKLEDGERLCDSPT